MHVTASGLRVFLITTTGAAIIISAGCGGGGSSAGGNANRKGVVAADRVLISPTNGTAGVRPEDPVVVRATGGRLADVGRDSGGRRVLGEFNRDHTQRRSRWTLQPGATINVRANAENAAGRRATAAS